MSFDESSLGDKAIQLQVRESPLGLSGPGEVGWVHAQARFASFSELQGTGC